MGLTQSIVRAQENSILRILDLSDTLNQCIKHPTIPAEADACPCQVALIWDHDRAEESIFRLKVAGHNVLRWGLWYMWSSRYTPWFPKQSIDCWQQTGQPLAAWERFNVARKNGHVAPENERAYLYYRQSKIRTGRAAAAQNRS